MNTAPPLRVRTASFPADRDAVRDLREYLRGAPGARITGVLENESMIDRFDAESTVIIAETADRKPVGTGRVYLRRNGPYRGDENGVYQYARLGAVSGIEAADVSGVTAILGRVAVAPEARRGACHGQSVFACVMNHLAKEAARAGCALTVFSVAAANSRHRTTIERLGYARYGEPTEYRGVAFETYWQPAADAVDE